MAHSDPLTDATFCIDALEDIHWTYGLARARRLHEVARLLTSVWRGFPSARPSEHGKDAHEEEAENSYSEPSTQHLIDRHTRPSLRIDGISNVSSMLTLHLGQRLTSSPPT
jgi:hypothetical protein